MTEQGEWRLDRGVLIGAVAGAAYPVDDRATEAFERDAASAAAAGILDAAIRAVERRRTGDGAGPGTPPDVPLNRVLFEPQTLRDLVEFLRHACGGMLTAREIVQEAILWQRLLEAGWPADARDARTITKAVDLLASVPGVGLAPPAPGPGP